MRLYAIKANNNLSVARQLASQGSEAVLVSGNQLRPTLLGERWLFLPLRMTSATPHKIPPPPFSGEVNAKRMSLP